MLQGAALAAALALLVAGCASAGADAPQPDPGSEVTDAERAEGAEADDSTEQDTSSSADAGAFTAAFEAEGLACTELAAEDLRGSVVQQFVCQGGDTVIVTIRDYGSADARDQQLAVIQDKACEIADTGQAIQRVAVSDTWLLMVGGDREVDFALFGSAMSTLGLDTTDYTC